MTREIEPHQTTGLINSNSTTASKHWFLKNPRDRLQLAPYLHQSLDKPRVRCVQPHTVKRRPANTPVGAPAADPTAICDRKPRAAADFGKGLAQGGRRPADRNLLRPKDSQVPTFPSLKNQNTEQVPKPKIQLKDKSRVTAISKPEGLSSVPEPTKYEPCSQHQGPILVEQLHPWDTALPASLMKNRITSRPRRGSRSEDPPAKPSPDPTCGNSIPDAQNQPTASPNHNQPSRPPRPPEQSEHDDQSPADRVTGDRGHKPKQPNPPDDDGDDYSEIHRRAKHKYETGGEGVSDGDWSRRSAESTGRGSLPRLGFLVVGCAN